MKFEKKFKVGVREIGLNNKITNLGMLGILEEIACMHSDTLGFGINDRGVTHKAWIIMDWKLKIIKRPQYDDNIIVKTWGKPFSKPRFYTYRDFEVFDESNNLLAIASSKWIYFDTEKNKISRIDLDMIEKYKPEAINVFDEEEIDKLSNTIISEKPNCTYTIRRADIDVNKHVHNLNYLSIAYETLPEDVYEQEELPNVRITYKHQIKLGETVKCYYSCIDGIHTVEIKSEDGKVLHSIIQLY